MQTVDWHARYQEQARWTKPLRDSLLNKIPIEANWSVLELGCGTGVILQDFTAVTSKVLGLDLDLTALTFQGKNKPWLVNADAFYPPFADKSIDLIYCHFFLLWLTNPAIVINLAKSLLKPGGYLAVFAEPDYASRQTAPEGLRKLSDLQNRSLAAQGAYLKIGRQLGQLMAESGLALFEFGSIKEENRLLALFTKSEKDVLLEDWDFLHHIREVEITKEELENLLTQTPERWYVPTYYALAQLKA